MPQPPIPCIQYIDKHTSSNNASNSNSSSSKASNSNTSSSNASSSKASNSKASGSNVSSSNTINSSTNIIYVYVLSSFMKYATYLPEPCGVWHPIRAFLPNRA